MKTNPAILQQKRVLNIFHGINGKGSFDNSCIFFDEVNGKLQMIDKNCQ